jgi:RimJ/RimL family protein N-acetyltransferase
MSHASFTTARLVLRTWQASDLDPFAAMSADPAVMKHYPSTLSREDSDAMAARIRRAFEVRGFGLWAVELPGQAPFIGYVGLTVPRFEAHFTPCVEIGWRLARQYWHQGYATEGARAALQVGFEHGLEEVVAMTVPANVRSLRVMEKLGMVHDPADDFDNPLLDPESPLRRHVLYRLPKARWASFTPRTQAIRT